MLRNTNNQDLRTYLAVMDSWEKHEGEYMIITVFKMKLLDL